MWAMLTVLFLERLPWWWRRRSGRSFPDRVGNPVPTHNAFDCGLGFQARTNLPVIPSPTLHVRPMIEELIWAKPDAAEASPDLTCTSLDGAVAPDLCMACACLAVASPRLTGQ